MMGRYKIFKKWHQDDENEELTSFGEKDGINNRVLNNVGEDIVKAKSNFYTRAGQLLGSTLLVETCLVLQDGAGNQIEKVYQKFEVEPETEEVTIEE